MRARPCSTAIVLSLALAGCGSGGGGGAKPVIASFQAGPASISAGQSSTLSWSVTGATTLSIDQGIGSVSGTSLSVSPAATTTYTLTAQNAAGATTAQATVTVGTASADVVVSVDVNASRHLISPFVYGYNAASAATSPPGTTWLRLGGNRWTAYNWETNFSNAGSDYLYENDTYMGRPSDGPAYAALPSLTDALAHGLGLCVTIPIQGWVSKDASGPLSQPFPDPSQHFLPVVAKKGAAFADPPDATDGSVYADEFAWYLAERWSTTTLPLHLMLDNEPDLWSSTHAEVQQTALTYAAFMSRSLQFAGALKDAVPGALLFGPVSYGWNGYVNLQNATDAATYGDFLAYYLSQMSQASASQGRRLLDVLDLHFYSEAQGCGVRVTSSGEGDCLVAARVQAPRSLWDPTYVESSWITQYSTNGQAIALVPRILAKIAANFPGTLLSLSEYNHGGEGHISGAVAQADTLGILGREGAYAASFWPLTSDSSFADGAWLSFRDYDGAGSAFGATSVSAASSDVAHLSAFASADQASPSRVVIVLVHRPTLAGSALDLRSRTVQVQVANAPAFGTARVWQLTSSSPVQAGVATPQRVADVPVSANAFTIVLPPLSVTTIELGP